MDIKKYSPYFHDGSIKNINLIGNEIVITMYSAQLDVHENEDNISLSRFNEIRGRLHLLNCKRVLINNVLSSNYPKREYGKILDLEFLPKCIVLNVSWRFKGKRDIYEGFIFESPDYYFENLPYLYFTNDCDYDDDGKYIGSPNS